MRNPTATVGFVFICGTFPNPQRLKHRFCCITLLFGEKAMKTTLTQFLTIILVLLATLAACNTVPVQPPTQPPDEPTDGPTPSPIIERPTQPPSPDTPTDNSTPNPSPIGVAPQPYAPQPGDEKLLRGNAFIESAEILVLESNPEQYSLHIIGSLPNPCYKLRLSLTPLQDGSINIEAYSLAERGSICIEVLQSFEATLPLNALPQGKHLILLNGEELGRITIR